MRKKVMDFEVIVEKDENGMYIAHIPDVPGCHTEGESMGEVVANIREVLRLKLEESKAS